MMLRRALGASAGLGASGLGALALGAVGPAEVRQQTPGELHHVYGNIPSTFGYSVCAALQPCPLSTGMPRGAVHAGVRVRAQYRGWHGSRNAGDRARLR